MGRLGTLFSLTVLSLASFGSPAAEADIDYRLCDGKRATIIAKHNDVTVQGTGKADVIVGTNGVDDIFGNGGNDRICGLGDSDRIFGGGGDDRLFGDASLDELNGGPGNDLLHGGANNGEAIFSDADQAVVVDLAAGTATSGAEGDILKKIKHVLGSGHDDSIAGDEGPNQLRGGGGDDILRGRNDADLLLGEQGADLLEGGPAEDEISGGPGPDVASYKGSPTGIDATLKHVDEFGDGPDEDLAGIEGLVGTNYGDILNGDAGNNNLSGLDGDDALFGFQGIDRLDGGAGSDTLEGYSGDDLIIGGTNDPVTAHGPVTELADLQFVSGDIAVYDEYHGNVTADLQEGTTTLQYDKESDSLEGIESILGTFDGNSDLTGDEGDNVLIGWNGFDVLNGAGGNDALYGYFGDDALVGGLGNDYLEGGDGDDKLTPGGGPSRPPFVGSDNDIINGGAQRTVTGDYLDYFDAPVAVNVDLASGTASGEGSDQISGIEWIGGSAFNDTLIGNDLTNILSGGLGNDTLNAGGGNDEIDGGQGDDSADGGEGGEGPSELPVAGDSCIKVETFINCEYVDGVPQESGRITSVEAGGWLILLAPLVS